MAASEEQNRLNTEQTQDGELEQYGVWVKAGPEDVDESDAEDEAFTLTDLGDEDLDDAELDLLGLDTLEDEDTDGEPATEDDLGEEIELDALDIDDEPLPSSDTEPEPEPEPESAPVTQDETDIDELLTIEEDEITLDFDDESSEEDEPAPLAEPELGGSEATSDDMDRGIDIDDELPGSLDDLTLDLDSLDVDSFAEASTAAPASEPTEEADELEELDLDTELDANVLNLDEEDLDLEEDELDLDSLSLGDEETEIAELDLSALSDDEDEDELPELEADDEEPFEAGMEESFDDIGAVENEMLSESPAPPPDDRSGTLLESIERELGSIRTELSDLKRELSQLREQPGRVIEGTPEPDDEAAGGFFEDDDEDEDETIALTGAELDNIMNTAEFTEEAGQPTDLDELLKEQPVEAESDAVQEITLEEAPEDFGTIDIDLGESPAPLFSGSDEDVEALASMDIDAELSDIEDLEDEGPAPPETVVEVETETETESDTDLDLIFDAEPLDLEEEAPTEQPEAPATQDDSNAPIPENLKGELRSVLNYMDKLLDSLPEEKIQEFAASEHFKVYKRLFEELGLEQ